MFMAAALVWEPVCSMQICPSRHRFWRSCSICSGCRSLLPVFVFLPRFWFQHRIFSCVADLLPGLVFASAAFISREQLWFPGLISADFILPSKDFPCPHSVLASCPGPYSCESFGCHSAWFAYRMDLSARFPTQACHEIFIFPLGSWSASRSRNLSMSPGDSCQQFFFRTESGSYSRTVELGQALLFLDLVPSPSCGRSCPKIRFFFAVRADFFFFWSPRQGPAGISFCSPALISALRIGISLKHAARSRFRLIYFATRTGALCSATVSALVLLASRATVSVRRFARPAPSRVICSFVSSFPVACVRSCPLRPRDSCCAANFRCRLNVVSLFFLLFGLKCLMKYL
jgi:hypothetical protein